MPKTVKPFNDGLSYREFPTDIGTLNDDERSINGIAATEQAVLMPDWDRMEMVPETLLMSGARFSDSVPLLNNHNRGDAEHVIGSARDLRNDGGRLLTRAVFSSTADGIYTRVKEGHLRDLSVGYRVERKRYVPKDKTERIAGREFTGPMNVVTSWTVREVSVTPIGADDQAKMRGLTGNPFEKGREVMLTQDQRDKLVARGMPEDLDDAAAVAWSIDNPEVRTVEKVVEKEVVRGGDDSETFKRFKEELKAEREAERKLHGYIREKCRKNGLEEKTQEVIDTCDSLESASRKIIELMEERQTKVTPAIGRFEFGQERNEKLGDILRASLLTRTLNACGVRGERLEKELPNRPQGWEDFRHASLMDIARMCLESEGVRLLGMTQESIARMALGFNPHGGLRQRAAFHTSASFPNLVLDAMNKSMLMGYTERNMTFQTVFRQAASVSDFKDIHRIRMSEAPNLSIWPDNTKPDEIAFTDEKETYAVEAYSNIASFSWRLLINDDMDALSRVPQLMGTAAIRTNNNIVWSIVTANPTMADGQPLFSNATGNRKQDNTTTGVINVANLGTARALMRTMTGVNTPGGNESGSILNLTPRYLVCSAARETTAQQILRSVSDPAATTQSVYNPFYGTLELIVEPLLDDAGLEAPWYLFADTRDIDTIEYCYLQGYETPQTEQEMDFDTSALKHKIVQVFGAKAIDHRGCIYSTGS